MMVVSQSWRSKLLTAGLFIFCGIPGVLAFSFSSLFLFAALTGDPIRGLEQPLQLLATSAIGALLALIGVGKLQEWMYVFVLLAIPASLMLFDWLNYKLHLASGLLEMGLFTGLITFLTLKYVSRYYANKVKNDGASQAQLGKEDGAIHDSP